MNFFVARVEWSDAEESHLMTFWAYADHIGEALDKIHTSAKAYDIPNPIVSAVDFADSNDLPEVAESYDDGQTFVDNTVRTFPTEPIYRLPYGVIESFGPGRGGYTTEDFTVGYATEVDEEDDEEDLFELRALIDEKDLLPIYLDLIDVLPDISVFWIKLQSDWEDPNPKNNDDEDEESTEIYTNTKLKSRQAIVEFIERNCVDILQNGHVTISTYSPTGETNLNISDHKMIVVLTYDEDIAVRMGQVLEERGVYEQYELVGPDRDFHHWHYRHPESRDRKGLIKFLKKEGFEFWDPN